jgi:hypothetical protein
MPAQPVVFHRGVGGSAHVRAVDCIAGSTVPLIECARSTEFNGAKAPEDQPAIPGDASRGERRLTHAGDLTLSRHAVVAQIVILQSASSRHFRTAVCNWGEENCKGSISRTHQRNLKRRFTAYVRSAVSK